MKKIKSMTRDNFDPVLVIGRLERLELSIYEIARLLNEACHVIHRQRLQLETCKRKAAELHAVTGGAG